METLIRNGIKKLTTTLHHGMHPLQFGAGCERGVKNFRKVCWGGEEVRNFYFGGWRVVLLRTGNFVGGMVTEF